MEVKVKRIYEKQDATDGVRILVDRLWPRGITKNEAKVDFWLKDLAPSPQLRKWFHSDKEKNYKKFTQKYNDELKKNYLAIKKELEKVKVGITIVTAVKDIDLSHIPTLVAFLKKLKN